MSAADDAIGKVIAVVSKDEPRPVEEIADALDRAEQELLAIAERRGRRSRRSR